MNSLLMFQLWTHDLNERAIHMSIKIKKSKVIYRQGGPPILKWSHFRNRTGTKRVKLTKEKKWNALTCKFSNRCLKRFKKYVEILNQSCFNSVQSQVKIAVPVWSVLHRWKVVWYRCFCRAHIHLTPQSSCEMWVLSTILNKLGNGWDFIDTNAIMYSYSDCLSIFFCLWSILSWLEPVISVEITCQSFPKLDEMREFFWKAFLFLMVKEIS